MLRFFEARKSGDEIRQVVQSFALNIDSFALVPVHSLWTHFKIFCCTLLCLSNMSKSIPKVWFHWRPELLYMYIAKISLASIQIKKYNLCKITYNLSSKSASALSRKYLLFCFFLRSQFWSEPTLWRTCKFNLCNLNGNFRIVWLLKYSFTRGSDWLLTWPMAMLYPIDSVLSKGIVFVQEFIYLVMSWTT